MSIPERALSLVSDDTIVAIATENEVLRETQARLQRRIVELETQIAEARTSVAEKKNADRIKAHDDILWELANPEGGLLPQVREALFGKRTLIESNLNEINNTLQGYADVLNRLGIVESQAADSVPRSEFDVLVQTVKTWKASTETENR